MVLILNDTLSATAAAALCGMLGNHESPDASGVLISALHAHPLFTLGVRPKTFSAVEFSCCEPGACDVAGAKHSTAAAAATRADVGVIVFLSDPSSYGGGELLVNTGYGEETYKEPAGTCIAYPAFARCRLAPVTGGWRWMASLTVQSLVRDQQARAILYDISCASRYLEIFGEGASPDLERLRRCQEVLLTMWTER